MATAGKGGERGEMSLTQPGAAPRPSLEGGKTRIFWAGCPHLPRSQGRGRGDASLALPSPPPPLPLSLPLRFSTSAVFLASYATHYRTAATLSRIPVQGPRRSLPSPVPGSSTVPQGARAQPRCSPVPQQPWRILPPFDLPGLLLTRCDHLLFSPVSLRLHSVSPTPLLSVILHRWVPPCSTLPLSPGPNPLWGLPEPRKCDQEDTVLEAVPGHAPADTFTGTSCRWQHYSYLQLRLFSKHEMDLTTSSHREYTPRTSVKQSQLLQSYPPASKTLSILGILPGWRTHPWAGLHLLTKGQTCSQPDTLSAGVASHMGT